MSTWQVVQEHFSLLDIFKFQVRISGSLPWEVDWLTLGPFPLSCASFCTIVKLTTRQPPGRVGQGFRVTVKLEAFIAFDHFSHQKMDS